MFLALRTPTDVKSLRSFLGLASYYRRFVLNFSKVAGPLHALTKEDVPYEWSDTCQDSFESLKTLLTTAPILCYPDFQQSFILETDTSGCGLGAGAGRWTGTHSICQSSLQKHERNYGITELEGLGVVWAVRHFHTYLYAHRCIVYTDHEALKSFLNTQPSGKLARWGMALQEMDPVKRRQKECERRSLVQIPNAFDNRRPSYPGSIGCTHRQN